MKQINKNKLTIKEGRAIVAEYYESKLKPKMFCVQKKIPYHILKYWRSQCYKVNIDTKGTAKFLPVKLLPPKPVVILSTPIKIVINYNLAIELQAGADLETLKNVIEVCKACG